VRARVAEGLVQAGAAKVQVADVVASGNPNIDTEGYKGQWAFGNATTNVKDVTIAKETGVITVETTTNAGGGTLTFTPNAPIGTVLPVGTAAFTPPADSIAWRCAADGAVTGSWAGVTNGTLKAKYAPSECK
jgi:type IV pilus assembly protein PilA